MGSPQLESYRNAVEIESQYNASFDPSSHCFFAIPLFEARGQTDPRLEGQDVWTAANATPSTLQASAKLALTEAALKAGSDLTDLAKRTTPTRERIAVLSLAQDVYHAADQPGHELNVSLWLGIEQTTLARDIDRGTAAVGEEQRVAAELRSPVSAPWHLARAVELESELSTVDATLATHRLPATDTMAVASARTDLASTESNALTTVILEGGAVTLLAWGIVLAIRRPLGRLEQDLLDLHACLWGIPA